MTDLSLADINSIVGAEESNADTLDGELGKSRERLMDFYNAEPFGDEIVGQSSVVTSDVHDVVEWLLPSLIALFTQAYIVGKFTADNPEGDEEAEQKTQYANYIFWRQNEGLLLLYTFFKDALLQYVGTLKVFWDDSEVVTKERYKGMSADEFEKLKLDADTEVDEFTENEDGTIDAKTTVTTKTGKVGIVAIPPGEFRINSDARDFVDPRFIGHKSPQTRSKLIQMGFDPEIVEGLPTDNIDLTEEELNRRQQIGVTAGDNPGNDPATDMIMLGEYYIHMDVDQDGIAELYQVFRAGETILTHEPVDQHPFCNITPIPIPHTAIGNCPAEETADLQLVNSTLLRQYLTNIYQSNYPRTITNDRVELDDLLVPRTAGNVRISGDAPVQDALSLVPFQDVSTNILQGLEHMKTVGEIRTGVGRINQGMEKEALNPTATAFTGNRDAFAQRQELIARIFANTGVKFIFEKIIKLVSQFQDDATQIRILGKTMEINPTDWRHNLTCRVDVGIGSGNRQEKIANLTQVLLQQQQLQQQQSPLTDNTRIYNTYQKLVTEVGLQDVSLYFNDPEVPEQLTVAENELLRAEKANLEQIVQQLSQTSPEAQAEIVKAQNSQVLQEKKLQAQIDQFIVKTETDNEQFRATLENEKDEFITQMTLDKEQADDKISVQLTKLELEFAKILEGQHIPGSKV